VYQSDSSRAYHFCSSFVLIVRAMLGVCSADNSLGVGVVSVQQVKARRQLIRGQCATNYWYTFGGIDARNGCRK
jgi:hypothetical protein